MGHETDTTLIDFVSDQRAPTPTAAAELAVPVRLELLGWTQDQGARLTRAAGQGIAQRRQRLSDLARALPRGEALLDTPRQRLDRATAQLEQALERGNQMRRLRLTELAGTLKPSVLNQRLNRMKEAFEREGARLVPGLRRALLRKSDMLEARTLRLRPRALQNQRDEGVRRLALQSRRLHQTGAAQLDRLSSRLGAASRMLASLGYEATLERGYAVVRSEGALVTRAAEAKSAPSLEIQFVDGRVSVGASAPKRAAKSKDTPEQGSLF